MHCPHCSKENPALGKYCIHCGRELPPAPEPLPGTHADSLNVAPVQYAGFWRRVVAAIIDTILLMIASAPFTWTFADDDFAFGFGIGTIIGWLYCAFMESSVHQATLGKLAIGIVVTDEHYRRISFARATGRHFASFLSAIILCVGYIMVAFTEKKQGLHDILAETLVVQK